MNNIQIYDENGNTLNVLSQYDTNRTIKILNYEYTGTGTTVVYFSNNSIENAYGVDGAVTDKTVEATIPNVLLTYPEKIQIYIAQEVSSGDNVTRKTYYHSELIVKERSMPADYIADNDVTYISITALKADLEQTISDVKAEIANGDFKGEKGADGKDGTTVKVGTTTTGAAGTNAKVSSSLNTTTNTLTLNFTIPRGADGTSGSSSTTEYTLPTATATTLGGIKVGTNLSIDDDGVLSAVNTTYAVATASANGLMSAADKTKLDGLSTSGSSSDNGVGKSLAGQTVYPTDGADFTAGTGAEIFNDYDERTYTSEGDVEGGNVASGEYSHAEGWATTSTDYASHAEGLSTLASGSGAHTEGSDTIASNSNAHAEGNYTEASGDASHAEGYYTEASGSFSHAEGGGDSSDKVTASGAFSHAEGEMTIASGYASHAEGSKTTASKSYAHAEGASTRATGMYTHVEGKSTVASNSCAHAEGIVTTASGIGSHAEGDSTTASGQASHAEGGGTTAGGGYSHAEGDKVTASGVASHAEGASTVASGDYSHAGGMGTIADNYQTVIGYYNAEKAGRPAVGDTSVKANYSIFIIGYGEGDDTYRKNAFRVDCAGSTYGVKAFNSSGADYAEYFEWADGNPNDEDRRGLFVTLDGEKIKLANNGDEIIGVISSNPSAIGDVQSEEWKDKYLKDVFGDVIEEEIEIEETTDEETGEIIPAHTVKKDKLNPDFDSSQEYISREFRKEWDAVGLLGKLIVCDDGTCEANGYCGVSENGVATKSDTGYRVLSRLDDIHIKILYK